MKEHCGVFGVYGLENKEASRYLYLGLLKLQHRGQESAGMVVADDGELLSFRGQGLAQQVFTPRTLDYLKGSSGIGHVRYSTSGESNLENSQPLLGDLPQGKIAFAYNGNILNFNEIEQKLQEETDLKCGSDSQCFLELVAFNTIKRGDLVKGLEESMDILKGGYAGLFLGKDFLLAFRDPYGIRPLSYGKKEKTIFFASESCALKTLELEEIKEVEPGEIILANPSGINIYRVPNAVESHFCLFEFIYFARPDSSFSGLSVYQARLKLGERLFLEHPIQADMVIGVPDSGITAALGYAYASSIPYGEGFVKNKYIGRTFIEPSQEKRELGVELKLDPLEENLRGKKIVMVDDSIVRGTTLANLVKMVKLAGAKDVHVLISSPPVRYPCFYGIDTPVRENLIASRMEIEEIKEKIGANSLYYLSLRGVLEALKEVKGRFCTACFDGHYPVL